MKRLFITIFIALFITGCVADTEQRQLASVQTETKENQPVIQTADTATPESMTNSDAEETAEETEPPIEETETEVPEQPEPANTSGDLVLVDEGGIRITAKSIDYSGWRGPELKLLIENNTDSGITVQTRDTSINGYMVEHSMSENVAAGKKVNADVAFSTSSLEQAGITTIADIQLSFHIYGETFMETVLDTGICTISTDASGTYQQQYDESGVLVYDENGIKIIAKGLTGDIFGTEVLFYVHNGTDTPITVQTRDDSVNGFMVNTSCSIEVTPGCRAIDGVTIFSSSLEENEITEIESYEFYFHIYGENFMTTIDESDPIQLTFS